MSTTMAENIYAAINDFRHEQLAAAYAAGQMNQDVPLEKHLASLDDLDAGDWVYDEAYGGVTLGRPDADWCVDVVDDDVVRVFCAGDVAGARVIPGACVLRDEAIEASEVAE